MGIALTDVVKRQGDLVFARMGEDVVMMSQDQSEYLGLNTVASAIWDLVAFPQTVAQLCEQLQKEFDVSPDQCIAEVTVFMDQMREKGLIQVGAG